MSGARDLVVIGAGPAGLACATAGARLGLDTLLVDEQPSPGGQVYRNVADSPLAGQDILGPDYAQGAALLRDFHLAGAGYSPGTTVWQVTPEREIGLLRADAVSFLTARRLVIATGAQERPMPLPGWTLPGVLGAGAGQILLKSGALVPAGPCVLAGAGPLLWLIAWQYLRAGIRLAAILETRHGLTTAALRHLPGALAAPGYLAKGLKMMAAVRRAGIPLRSGVSGLRALGDSRVTAVEAEIAGRRERFDCAVLLLHQGVVPNTQMTRALDCDHHWDEAQACWRPRLDAWGTTQHEGIAVAGDGGGIIGAQAAALDGRLAALEAGRALGKLSVAERDRQAAPILAERRRHLRIRPFLDALYRPLPGFLRPPDETLVCRCEEVTAGAIRDMARLGCQGPNQTKAFTRCGMGPCQGRLCGLTVAELIAEVRGVPVAQVGAYRIRPPIKPVSLQQLAEAAPFESGDG